MYDSNDYTQPTVVSISGSHAGGEDNIHYDRTTVSNLKSHIELYDRLTLTPDHIKDAYDAGYLEYCRKLKYKEKIVYSRKDYFRLTTKAKQDICIIMSVPLTRKEEYLQMIYKDL